MAIKTIKVGLSGVFRAPNDVMKQRFRPIHALIFCLAILPACLHGLILLKYGVNVPFGDDWSQSVELFRETSQGTLSFGDLIAQNNESRPFFPNLIFIALAFLTNWDLRYEMLVTLLLACLVSFNVYYLGKRTIDGSPLKRLAVFFLSNLFIFAPVQAGNWLWGIQLIVFMPIACITTCLSVAYSSLGTRTKFLICMVLSTISTFSYANGMLCWVVVFPVLALSGTWSDLAKKKWLISGWMVGFALNAALYFHDYQRPPSHPVLSEALVQPVQALQYFLAFLGAPYSHILPVLVRSISGRSLVTPAMIFGAVLLLLFMSSGVYLLSSRNFVLVRQAIGWLTIGAYSIISALVATFGRLGFGVEQSLALRYTTFSLYLAVSLIYLIAIVFNNVAREGNPSRSGLLATALGSLIVPVVFLQLLTSVYWPIVKIPPMSLERSDGKACLLLINVVRDDECLTKKVYPPGVDILQGLATSVNDMGFLMPGLIESDKIRDIEGARSGSATYGRFGSLTKTDEGSYLASGWAISPDKGGRPADAVLLAYEDADGEPTVFAVVADKSATKAARALNSGWQETFSPDAIPAGPTKISAWAFDADTGKAFELDGTHMLE